MTNFSEKLVKICIKENYLKHRGVMYWWNDYI